MEKLNLSQYARLRGCSVEAVRVAIKSGRLVNAVSKNEKGKTLIDPVVANLEWAANTDGSKQHNIKNKPPRPEPITPFLKHGVDIEEVAGGKGITASQGRDILEVYKAKLAKLEYEEKVGKLIDSEKVKTSAFKIARMVRDSLLNIPDRLAAELSGITEADIIHTKLGDEINKALDAMQSITLEEENGSTANIS